MSRTSSKLATEILWLSLSYRWYAVKTATQVGTARTASTASSGAGADTGGSVPMRSATAYVMTYAMTSATMSAIARIQVRPLLRRPRGSTCFATAAESNAMFTCSPRLSRLVVMSFRA